MSVHTQWVYQREYLSTLEDLEWVCWWEQLRWPQDTSRYTKVRCVRLGMQATNTDGTQHTTQDRAQ